VGKTLGPSSVNNLRIWHEGIAVVKESYKLSGAWPKSEIFGLTSQVRRAAVSIPCNLAEGRGRGTNPEMARFAQIALGSLYELDTLLLIAAELKLSDETAIYPLRDRLSILSRQISSFIYKRKVNT
jgi:four helix bundle protein